MLVAMAPVSRDGTSEATTSTSHPPPQHPSSSPSPRGQLTIPGTSTQIHIPKKFHSMTAGAGAGLVSSIVTCPLDVLKTQLQAQHSARNAKEYQGVRLTVLRIWRQSGFRGFYRGLGPTLGGYLPTWGIYFTVYDLVKDRLGNWVSGGEFQSSR
jgi:solute carrier family 25 folate transporter 32